MFCWMPPAGHRHNSPPPDLPLHRRRGDIEKSARLQAALLEQAAEQQPPMERLFTVCSLEPEEGEGVAQAFLARRDDFSSYRLRQTKCRKVCPWR